MVYFMVGGRALEAPEDSDCCHQMSPLLISGLLDKQKTKRPEVRASFPREKISLVSPFPGSWLSSRPGFASLVSRM